jgi:hypothetical protein
MALPYREFASYLLRDLALREQSKYRDRITFSGNHISHQYQIPVRGQNETVDQFAARREAFRRMLPRHSDLTFRMAMAMEACRRVGDTTLAAATYVRDQLRKLRQFTATRRLELGRLGIPYKRIKSMVGRTHRGRRSRRKQHGLTPTDREAETIRSQVSRFRRRFEGFEQRFEAEFSRYRYWYHQDADWFAEEEARCRQLMIRCEKELGPNHEVTATNTFHCAHALHEQGKFDEAESLYQLALHRWHSVVDIPRDQHEDIVASILTEIGRCNDRVRPVPRPQPTILQ